ncbi:MAG: sulfite exporter TauE/SafE family protein, partial [Chloroflexota bacterium]
LSMARRREPAPVVAAAIAGGAPTASSNLSAGPAGPPAYVVRRMGWGIVGSLFAGLVSALLGIGGGLVKVPVMHLVMGVPLRVATATSNLMIGITAAASAIIYLLRGGIDVYVAGPTAVGVFMGASIGSRTVHRIDIRLLRMLFVGILLVTAWQMAGRVRR